MLKSILNKIVLGKDKYPLCGSKIKITWLPYKNCYIGEVGVVDEICADNKGFWMRLSSGASLYIGNRFKNASTKKELATILDQHDRFLEDMLCDAKAHLDNFKRKLGLSL